MTRHAPSTARAARGVRIFGAALVVVGVLGLLAWAAVRQHRREQARNLVRAVATQMSAATDADGRHVYHTGDVPEDPWGRRLAITYNPAGTVGSVTVRSAGPDRKLDTRDDIATTCFDINRRRVADRVEEVARAAGRGVVKGIGEGIRETASSGRDTATAAATQPAGLGERAGRSIGRGIVRDLRDAVRRGKEKAESSATDQ